MCSWTKVLTVILIVYLKCVIAYPRRTTYRVYRKSSSPPPFLAHLLSLPPSRAPPRNFNADYDLPPPFMMMPSMAPPSTSYGEPIMDYGPPRKEYPSSDYGPPPPTSMKPIIFKHIYVHIPPPEPPEMTTSRQFHSILFVRRHFIQFNNFTFYSQGTTDGCATAKTL